VQLQNWRTNVAGIEATGKVQKGRSFRSEKAQCVGEKVIISNIKVCNAMGKA
jgi:hypothetical protein